MENSAKFRISLGLLVLFGLAEIGASKSRQTFPERLTELWEKRKDKSQDFYQFMATVVMPRQNRLFRNVDTNIPSYFAMDKPKGVDFPCKLFHNHTNPKSVHRLKPSDIDYVAAMGDSITAAFGAKSCSLLDIFVEFRGVSWSIGGDKSLDQVVTLPNILREYYDNVKGFSVKTTPPKIRIPWRARLNFAVSGAISLDLPGQAKKLIRALKSRSDFQDSWKLLTVWIGGNDLCAICKNDKHTVDKYVGGIRDALDMFHKEVPKMFVNLVQIIDVTELGRISKPYCKLLHRILCKCGTSAGEQVKEEVKQMAIAYRAGVEQLIDSGRYDTRDDFTVVIQPFFTNTKAPLMPDNSTIDMSYFAPDCFHFSEKGHRAAALALWNSMIEPVGKKRLEWKKGEEFECPTQTFPYFFTKKNSDEFLKRPNSPANQVAGNTKGHIDMVNQDSHKHNGLEHDAGHRGIPNTMKKRVLNGLTVCIVVAAALITVCLVALFVNVMRKKQSKHRKTEPSEGPTKGNTN